MATSVGTEDEVVALVQDLVVLEYDVIAAYEAAIGRLKDGVAKDRLTEFCNEHRRHARELSAWLRERDEATPSQGDLRAVLTQGRVFIGGLMGDRTVLQAMRANEDDTHTAYQRATARDDLDASLSALLHAGLEDERRHCAWLQTYLVNTSGD